MDWKLDIFCQLKKHKHQWNVYDEIIEHCMLFIYIILNQSFFLLDNRLLENNSILQTQRNKLEKDVNHLRLANSGLEKASEARLTYFSKLHI
jgi:hypothetical protein